MAAEITEDVHSGGGTKITIPGRKATLPSVAAVPAPPPKSGRARTEDPQVPLWIIRDVRTGEAPKETVKAPGLKGYLLSSGPNGFPQR